MRIRIRTVRTFPDGAGDLRAAEEEPILTEAEGRLGDAGDGCSLFYDDGEEGVRTRNRVFLSEEEVRIEREGEVISSMRFREGEVLPADYRTAYGELDLAVKTRCIRLERGSGGERTLFLDYDLILGGKAAVRCELELTAVPV